MSKTEEQIIQALRICQTDTICKTCPYFKAGSTSCMAQLSADVLSLIERAKKDVNDTDSFLRNLCKERLLNGNEITTFEDLQSYINNQKSEAIKDFAKALKSKTELVAPSVYAVPYRAVSVDDIDNLVEEMTGGEDND